MKKEVRLTDKKGHNSYYNNEKIIYRSSGNGIARYK